MKTIWQTTDKQELLARLAKLNSAATPQWGKLNCPQMLAHVADGMRMTLGDLQCQPKRGPLRFGPLKKLIIYWLPFPKGAPTAPELIARAAEGIEPERAAVVALLERMAADHTRQDWPEHPAFGKLSAQDWGALVYKHLDHHLRQFGV
ncbi:MAG: DUF1569 domain-containing protein [Acidobacteria bacterium]|nr:DUF1569 domain-containing protein [Acidobacteriota bacterium]MBI3427028.1 DUF1569 domain-containing protein [Acidobacteriota bacterium]